MQTIDILLNRETRTLASKTIKNAFLIDPRHSSACRSHHTHTLIIVVIGLIRIQLQGTALVTAWVIIRTKGGGTSYPRYVL